MNQTASSFTGRQRRRTTHWSVKFKDRVAKTVIMIGGLGTIIAVSTVCLFLVAVVIPLFRAPETDKASRAPLPQPDAQQADAPVHVAVDDYNLMAWAVYRDGVVRKFRLDNGEVLDEIPLSNDVELTAWSFPQRDSMAVFGYEDGSVRYATIQFNLRFIDEEDAPQELQGLEVGQTATFEKGLIQMTRERQLRHVTLDVELQDPVPTGAQSPVIRLDHTGSRNEINYAAMTEDGRIFMQRARGRRNMLTGAITYRTTTGEVEYAQRAELPDHVKLTGLGDNLYVIWADGILQRFDTRDYNAIGLMETVDISPASGIDVTSIGYMIGKTTLLVGDSSGQVAGWFRVRPDSVVDDPGLAVTMRELSFDDEGHNRGEPTVIQVKSISTPDDLALVPVQHLEGPVPASPVRSLSASQRKRMFVAGHENGMIRVHNATVQRLLFELELTGNEPVEVAQFNPRDDGLIGVSAGSVGLWHISVPHSEATWAAYSVPSGTKAMPNRAMCGSRPAARTILNPSSASCR